MKKMFLFLLVACISLISCQAAYAVPGGCPDDGATLLTIGGPDPINGFPATVLDSNGVAFEICLDPVNCVFDPIEVGNAFSEQIGFGEEGFWWSADASLEDAASDTKGILVMAAEAAFNPEVIADGNQFPFTRLRIRVDVGFAGTYTITYPYGRIVYPDLEPGRRVINDSFDIDFKAVPPNGTHQGRIGPFLVWEPLTDAPVGFVGDPAVEHVVSGSPCNTNEFRISAVDSNGAVIDLNGAEAGNDLVTDLFRVQGKLFDGQLTAPLIVNRASYSRSGGRGRVNIFATSTTNAVLTTEKEPLLPLAVMDRSGDIFFHSYFVTDPLAIPDTLTVTASIPGFDDGVAISTITDEVSISLAEYDVGRNILTLSATSSDLMASPVLTLSGGLGNLAPGVTRSIAGVMAPPASITVTSSSGGTATRSVDIVTPSSFILFIPPIISGGVVR